jgi:hypothetical protein
LPLLPPPVCLEHPAPSAACSFLVPCFLFYFIFLLGGGGSICPGSYAGLSQGWLWEYCVLLICSPVLLDVSQAGLDLSSGGMGALLFSWCYHGMEKLCTGWGSGCLSPDSSWCFFSAKCGSSTCFLLLHSSCHFPKILIVFFCNNASQ